MLTWYRTYWQRTCWLIFKRLLRTKVHILLMIESAGGMIPFHLHAQMYLVGKIQLETCGLFCVVMSDDMMTWWHDDMMTWWHDDMMTWWHDDMMTWWHDDMMIWWLRWQNVSCGTLLKFSLRSRETRYRRQSHAPTSQSMRDSLDGHREGQRITS
jgi:hypothetical protein